MERIIADLKDKQTALKIRVNPLNQRHPRSIIE